MSAETPAQQAPARLQIGDVWIDLRFRRIERPDGQVELPQRMFDLLMVFVGEPGVLHTRETLFRRVWPGVVVEDANLSQSVWMLRKALGDERRHWLRTVPKGGYVFEPDAVDGTSIEPPIATPAAVARQTAGRRRASTLRWLLAPLLIAIAGWIASLGGSTPLETRAAARATPAPLTIALLQALPAGTAPQWPAALVEETLAWRLDLLPDAVVIENTAAALEAGPPRTTIVVVLSAHAPPGQPDTLRLQARIGPKDARDAAIDTLVAEGRRSEAATLAETMTRQILDRLLPARRGERWPALALDPATAERYADAGDALRRRDWAQARSAAEAVVRAAPQFGPAHTRLAVLDMRQGRYADALDRMVRARRLLQPLPADAARLLDARIATLDPRGNPQALSAYASLVRAHPGRVDHAVTLARLLTEVGRARDAHALLSRLPADADATSPGLRLRRLLALAETELALGAPARAREPAREALGLAMRGGAGWEQELGTSRMLLGRIHHMEPGARPSPELFELAAAAFDDAGDGLSALYARWLAEEVQAPQTTGLSPRMRILLAEARTRGYAGLEIELLRRAAYRSREAGDQPAYRGLLQEALAAADRSGDLALQDLLALDLLGEDMLIGNHVSARARIERLRRSAANDGRTLWVAHFEGAIRLREGALREALAGVREELRTHVDGTPGEISVDAARLACLETEILIAMGDLRAARARLEHCRRPEIPVQRLGARLLEAGLDILEGDRAHARALLDAAEAEIAAMPDHPDRWMAADMAAGLLLRTGEYDRAARLYAAALPAVDAAGYALLAASMRAGQAEIAMARRDTETARRIADAARRALPGRNWYPAHRLDTLDVVDALIAGDREGAAAARHALRRRAQAHGDAIVMAELDSLTLPTERDAAATAHPPGATLDWLLGPALPAGMPAAQR